MNKRIYKGILTILWLLCHVIPIWAVQAQDKIVIEFDPYDDQRFAKLTNFPEVETRFLLKENGKHVQQAFVGDNFRVYEDNQLIAPLDYAIESKPIHLTIIIDVETYKGLPETGDGTFALAKTVYSLTEPNDLFQLCFTLGQPACKTKYSNDFDFLFESLRGPIVTDRLTRSAKLSDILQLSLDNAEGHQQVPVVVLIRDDVDRSYIPNLGMSDLSLARIMRMGGSFVVIDENDNPAYKDELQTYLLNNGAYYYPGKGNPNPNSTEDNPCKDLADCLQQRIKRVRPLVHVLKYRSYLFQDANPHEVRIVLNVPDNSRLVENTTTFNFRATDSSDTVKSWVRKINTLLAVISPLLLMLILVLGTNQRS